MAECPGNRNNRGTRSQLRIRTPNLLSGLYPVHLGDIMEPGQSSQTGILSASDIVQSNRGTRTRAVREYEQTISELKKENFDLKLRVFLFEEAIKKHPQKEKDGTSPEKENTVQVFVQLKLETESLHNELNHKEQLLDDAVNQAETLETVVKELKEKLAEVQPQLSLLSELPSKEEFQLLVNEKENLLKQNEALQREITEKSEEISHPFEEKYQLLLNENEKLLQQNDALKREIFEKNEEINVLNQRIEIVCAQNTTLEDKIEKKSKVIQSLIYKSYKDFISEELRDIVKFGTQAALNKNTEDIVVAVENFRSTLNQILSSSSEIVLNKYKRVNISQPQPQCLNEVAFEKSSVILPSQSESSSQIKRVQDVFPERDVPVAKILNLESTLRDSSIRGINVCCPVSAERDIKDVVDFRDSSVTSCKVESSDLISFSNTSGTIGFPNENVVNIDTCDSTQDKSIFKGLEKSLELHNVLKENEQLKLSNEQNLKVIQDMQATVDDLVQKAIQLSMQSKVPKTSEYTNIHTQTDLVGCNLLQQQEMSQIQATAKLSNNMDELREAVLSLLLTIELKEKELTDVKETLSSVQKDLKKALSVSKIEEMNAEFDNERRELHERLAISYSVNVELMKHLKKLESFMEDLLQQRFDSSIENISERSDFYSNISKCLNESLKLSHVLSDNLSVCEGSKLFEEYESFLNKNGTLSSDRSFSHLDASEFTLPDDSMSFQRNFFQGGFFSCLNKNEIQETVKGSFGSVSIPGDQVCSRLWEPMNCVDKPNFSHSIQNYNAPPKPIGYLSSDSDIWSEPDRDVSMQRIGICLKTSPFTSKSPRRCRLKDKKMSNKLTTEWNTSSTDKHNTFKQRRNGSASRRLFDRESTRIDDSAFEKFYNFLNERFCRLNLLMNDFESIRNEKDNEELWLILSRAMTSLSEMLQKFHSAKENAKSLSPVECIKCSILDLYVDLEAFYSQIISCIPYITTDDEIEDFQKFKAELYVVKQECKELLSLSRSDEKIEKSVQCKLFDEKDYEKEIDNLKQKLLKLISAKETASIEKISESTQCETSVKSDQDEIDDLKEKISDLRNEKESYKISKSVQCEIPVANNLTEKDALEQKILDKTSKSVQCEIPVANNLNGEDALEQKVLDKTSKSVQCETPVANNQNEKDALEQKTLDKTSKSVQCKIPVANNVNEKDALEEKLSMLIHKNESLTEKLNQSSVSMSEMDSLFNSLEAENAELCDKISRMKERISSLEQKENELSLQNTKLRNDLKDAEQNKIDSSRTDHLTEKISKSTQCQLSEEDHENKINYLEEKILELSNEKQVGNIEKTSTSTQCQIPVKSKVESLEQNILQLRHENEALNEKIEEINASLHEERSLFDSVKTENAKLSSEINRLEEQLLLSKQNKKELTLQKDELGKRCSDLNVENSELKHLLEDIELSKNEYSKSVEQLTEELHQKKSENTKLSNEIIHLKEQLSLFEQKERELLSQNNELREKHSDLNNENKELKHLLKDIELHKDEYNKAFNELTDELHQKKLDLMNMNEKCLEYEKELEAQINLRNDFAEKYETLKQSSNSEKEDCFNKIKNLNIEKDRCIEMLNNSEEKVLSLKKQNVFLNKNLGETSKECCMLKEIVEKLENQKENLNITCKDLQIELDGRKSQLNSLKERCIFYEKEAERKLKMEEKQNKQFKQWEEQSILKTQKLLDEISHLKTERDNVSQKLEEEKQLGDRLLKEKTEISQKLDECYKVISSLTDSNAEMEATQSNLSQKNKRIQGSLSSSNAQCEALSNDLKIMRETLNSLEFKCAEYEKELETTIDIKGNLIQCLIKINNEFTMNRHKLNELYKLYGCSTEEFHEQLNINISMLEKYSVKELCSTIVLQSKKLLEMVDALMNFFKEYHARSNETEKTEKKDNMKRKSLEKKFEMQKAEAKQLKAQTSHFEKTIDELQKIIAENKKSAEQNAFEIQTLKKNLDGKINEVEHSNSLLKMKDDEITHLEERLFNLQTSMNKHLAEKAELQTKPSSSEPVNIEKVGSSPKSKADSDYSNKTLNDSFDSVSSAVESHKSSCCGKIWKKYHALKTKLVLCEKRIEILQQEKDDLRNNFTSQSQTEQDDLDGRDSTNAKMLDLESRLERKKAFIRELKSELLRTCNSLMDKEREIDGLKLELSRYEKKTQILDSGLSELQSKVKLQAVDANIKNLRSYKWELIQIIFNLQRKFYEKKGIHLDYFEKFKNHVDNLYSIHMKNSLSKSESMPLIGSEKIQDYVSKNDRLKYLLSLELDVQCLENLKIFLNRFLAPYILEHSTVEEMKSPEKFGLVKAGAVAAEIVEDETAEILMPPKHPNFIEFSCSASLLKDIQDTSDKTYSLAKQALGVSHNIDYIEHFFKKAESQSMQLKNLEFSSEDHVLTDEAKTLLTKVFNETKALYGKAGKLFTANAALKNLDFLAEFIPTASIKLDVSDKESVMSEETITISRSITPASVDEVCHVKLPVSDANELEEKVIGPRSLTGNAVVNEPYSSKLVTVSSYDSLCQRSQYSSPDLGIESDPNHDSSAPEQKEDALHKYQKAVLQDAVSPVSLQPKTTFTSTDSSNRWKVTKVSGGSLHCIASLQQYELLKREIQECLVGIRSVLSRTGEGLPRIAKYTSPRKTLEYSTLKAIKDTCANIQVCLKESYDVIGNFRITVYSTEQEWQALFEENQHLHEKISHLQAAMNKQEGDFKKALEKLEDAKVIKEKIEKKISRKLVKTKKVIRQAELKLIEHDFQNVPPVPRYFEEQSSHSLHKS